MKFNIHTVYTIIIKTKVNHPQASGMMKVSPETCPTH